MRENSASLEPVEDRGAQLGDTVTANFHGKFLDAPADEPINVEDVDVVLGGKGVVQEITDNLTGTKPDDEKTFTVDYPQDFSAKGLAGKEEEKTLRNCFDFVVKTLSDHPYDDRDHGAVWALREKKGAAQVLEVKDRNHFTILRRMVCG